MDSKNIKSATITIYWITEERGAKSSTGKDLAKTLMKKKIVTDLHIWDPLSEHDEKYEEIDDMFRTEFRHRRIGGEVLGTKLN